MVNTPSLGVEAVNEELACSRRHLCPYTIQDERISVVDCRY